MIRYVVESMSHEYVAYRENRPDVVATNDDPVLALKELRKREHAETFVRGTRVSKYDDMGENSYGIVLDSRPGARVVLVRFDGYSEPDGKRNEPWEYWMYADYLSVDIDPERTAIEDQKRMLPGYERIEATL